MKLTFRRPVRLLGKWKGSFFISTVTCRRRQWSSRWLVRVSYQPTSTNSSTSGKKIPMFRRSSGWLHWAHLARCSATVVFRFSSGTTARGVSASAAGLLTSLASPGSSAFATRPRFLGSLRLSHNSSILWHLDASISVLTPGSLLSRGFFLSENKLEYIMTDEKSSVTAWESLSATHITRVQTVRVVWRVLHVENKKQNKLV